MSATAPAAMLHASMGPDILLPLCRCRHLRHTVSHITSTLQPTQHFGPFEDVQLGPLLGQGSFGRVYRGVWQGAAVAIKVICRVLPGQCAGQAGCVGQEAPDWAIQGQQLLRV